MHAFIEVKLSCNNWFAICYYNFLGGGGEQRFSKATLEAVSLFFSRPSFGG